MLDQLLDDTRILKTRFIKLGIALSPPACVHNYKLTQLKFDFREMARSLGHQRTATLYEHAEKTFQTCIPIYFTIQNLKDLKTVSEYVRNYMSHYFIHDHFIHDK